MKAQIVHSNQPVTLIGGAMADSDTIRAAQALAPLVVAADGGAAAALRAGASPSAVIGDLDSIDAQTRAAIDPARLHQITEQDTTDFDKALRSIAAPLVLGVGFLGGRRDHELANFNALALYPDRRCILIGAEEIVMLCPPELSVPLQAGCRVSLFPLGPAHGRSTGLHWPLDGIAFAPDGRVGTSNKATGPVCLRIETPNMLLILPRPELPLLVQALASQPAQWPARAQ